MQASPLEYTFDGTRYVGHLALPDGDDPRPGVLVCHEGPGMTDHPRRRAERLAAELGVIAFALDYWGGGQPLGEDERAQRLGAAIADPSSMRPVAMAGLEQLLAQPRLDRDRVAAIGYCFGGSMAIDLARGGAPLCCVVGFHSGLGHPHPATAELRAAVLVLLGADDPIITADDRAAWIREMDEAGVEWQMHVYSGTGHSFTNRAAHRGGYRFHERSDRRSWEAMCDYFAEQLGTPRCPITPAGAPSGGDR